MVHESGVPANLISFETSCSFSSEACPATTLGGVVQTGPSKWKLFGKTASHRYIVVVFTVRQKLFRTVTAHEMDAVERSKHNPQID